MSTTARRRVPPPTVILPSGRVQAPIDVTRATGVGSLAHLVISLLAPAAKESPARTSDACLALAHQLAAPSPRSKANAVLAAGFANEYLLTVRPSPAWTVLGVEYDTGDGRVDLAYRNAMTEVVFFDEIKTTHVPSAVLNRDWISQAHRYAAAGMAKLGLCVAGTRLTPLGSRHLTALVTADGRVRQFTPSTDAPLPVRT